MAISSFLFGGDTGETPETLARKRAVAQALAVKASGAPKNVGEGLSAIGNALLYRSLMGKVDAGDAAGRTSADSDFAPLLNGFGSSAPGGAASAVPMPGAQSQMAATSPATGSADIGDPNDIQTQFLDTVKTGYDAGNGQKLAVTNPFGLAAIAATGKAESGWSPKNAGGTWADGKNPAGGILSWNGPRLANLQKFAGGTNGSPQQQAQFFLQENPDLVNSLNNAKSVEEAQRLMNNAWAFKGYDQPGNANAAHRLALAASYLPQFQGNASPAAAAIQQQAPIGGQEVASLDPSSGTASAAQTTTIAPSTATPAQPQQSVGATQQPYVDPQVTTAYAAPAPQSGGQAAIAAQMPQGASPVAQALAGPQAAQQPLPPLPIGNVPNDPSANPPPVQMAQNAPSAVAQALAGGDASGVGIGGAAPKPGGYFPAAPSARGQTGPSQQQILRVLMNPYATESQRSVAQYMLEKQQQNNDPLRQLQIQELQTKIDQEKNPLPDYAFTPLPDGTVIRTEKRSGNAEPVYQGGAKPQVVNNRLVDTQSGKVLADFSDPKTQVVGDKVIDTSTGKVLYEGTPAPKWSKLDNGTLFNEATGETKSANADGKPAGFRFSGESIEGQALNGLMDSKQLTETQAQQVASGKQISGPNGEILFMTPQGLVSQPANGGQIKLVSPAIAPQAAAPQPAAPQGINLFPDEAPQAPGSTVSAGAPVSPQQQTDIPNGAVQLTGPKAPNKDELDAAGYADRLGQADNIIGTAGSSGTSRTENLLNQVPLVGNSLTSSEFQQYEQAKKNFINAQLRRESGAVIGKEEFENADQQYFPQVGDGPDVIRQKAENRKLAISNMARSAGPTYKGGAAPPAKIRKYNPATGTIE